jgi:GntR family transcriptional regulator
MHIRISSSEGVPIYLQIVHQVKSLVASGILSSGDEIPPIRTLAERLLINPNTVARAYLELERAGVVKKKQGFCTYIAEAKTSFSRRDKIDAIKGRVDALLVEAQHLGLGLDEVTALLRERHVVLLAERTK